MRSNLFIKCAWDHLFMSATFDVQMEVITEKSMGIFSIKVFSEQKIYVFNLKKASFTGNIWFSILFCKYNTITCLLLKISIFCYFFQLKALFHFCENGNFKSNIEDISIIFKIFLGYKKYSDYYNFDQAFSSFKVRKQSIMTPKTLKTCIFFLQMFIFFSSRFLSFHSVEYWSYFFFAFHTNSSKNYDQYGSFAHCIS